MRHEVGCALRIQPDSGREKPQQALAAPEFATLREIRHENRCDRLQVGLEVHLEFADQQPIASTTMIE